MTPEERATDLIESWGLRSSAPIPSRHVEDIAAVIRTAERAAVVKEREACAQIGDRLQKEADQRAHDSADPGEGADGAAETARLIRARGGR